MQAEIKVMKHLMDDTGLVLKLHDVLEDANNLYMILEICRGSDVLGERCLPAASRSQRWPGSGAPPVASPQRA